MTLEYIIKTGIEDIQKIFDINVDLYQLYIKEELSKNEEMSRLVEFRNSLPDFKVCAPLGGMGTLLNAYVLYCLIRYYNIDNVIETGISSGFFSSFLLSGLIKNNSKSSLLSLELSDDMRYVGNLVPESLKSIWTIKTGESSLNYFKAIKNKNITHNASLYCHDSLHKMHHMLKELNEFKQSTSSQFFIYIDDPNSEDFWTRCVNSDFFKKHGFDVKYLSGKESRLKSHLGGFVRYAKNEKHS